MADPAAPPPPAGDELDPELISLKKPRARLGPVLALSVLVLCGYLAWITRHDLAFATRAATPEDVTLASATGDNRYVRLTGAMPDLRHVGWLLGPAASGHRLLPMLGSSGRVWLHITDDVYSGKPAYDLRFTGRLRALERTTFGGELAGYLKSVPPLLSVFEPKGVTGEPWVDVVGDQVSVAPGDPVTVDERVPGVVLVTLYLNDHVKDEAAASAALTAAGLPPQKLVRKNERSWTFEVAGDKAATTAKIEAADLYAAMGADAVADELVRHEGVRSQLTVGQGVVSLASGETIPFDRVARITAKARPTLARDAVVLMVGEDPGAYWYLFVLYGVLGLVALAMIWAIARGLRARGPSAVPLSFKPPPVVE